MLFINFVLLLSWVFENRRKDQKHAYFYKNLGLIYNIMIKNKIHIWIQIFFK